VPFDVCTLFRDLNVPRYRSRVYRALYVAVDCCCRLPRSSVVGVRCCRFTLFPCCCYCSVVPLIVVPFIRCSLPVDCVALLRLISFGLVTLLLLRFVVVTLRLLFCCCRFVPLRWCTVVDVCLCVAVDCCYVVRVVVCFD